MIQVWRLRISEAELARDVGAAKVAQGRVVIVEREDHRPVSGDQFAPSQRAAIVEILREAKRRNSTVTLDEGFGKDLEEVIASDPQPPSWD